MFAAVRNLLPFAIILSLFFGCGDINAAPAVTGKKSPIYEADEKFLSSLSPVAGGPMNEPAEVDGRHYANSVILTPNSPWEGADVAEYNLSRDWQYLEATLGIRDDAPADARAISEVFGDGRRIYRNDMSFGHSGKVRINVRGVLRLKLSTTWLSGDDVYSIAWGDAVLKQ